MTVLSAASTTLALTGVGRDRPLPRSMVTGLSTSPAAGTHLATGLVGMVTGHLLTQVGVAAAKREQRLQGRHFVLRTQLDLNPYGFMVGVGGRF